MAPRLLILTEHAPPLVARGDLPSRPVRHHLTSGACFVSQEPVAELGIIAVSVEQSIRPVCLDQLRLRRRIGEPPVVVLTVQAQYPTRPGDGDPVCGQLANERESSLWADLPSKERRCPSQDLIILVREPDYGASTREAHQTPTQRSGLRPVRPCVSNVTDTTRQYRNHQLRPAGWARHSFEPHAQQPHGTLWDTPEE